MKPDSLLILNRSASEGRAGEQARTVQACYETHFDFANRRTVIVPTHAAAKASARAFLSRCRHGGVVLTGGGAGTLRAVVEGLCVARSAPPTYGRVAVAPLRMGSGNVLARVFGVSADPEAAIAEAAENVKGDVIHPCSVMRCDVDGRPHFAMTLIGLGQFGRIPRDLSWFHATWPRTARLLAARVGVERRTAVEYRVAMGVRATACCLRPSRAEEIDLSGPTGGPGRVRLLAGAIANIPVPGIPLPGSLQAGRPELSGILLDLSRFSPLRPRVQRLPLTVSAGEPVHLRLVGRQPAPFFLDEDALLFGRDLRIGIGGTLGIIPGPAARGLASRLPEADERPDRIPTDERST